MWQTLISTSSTQNCSRRFLKVAMVSRICYSDTGDGYYDPEKGTIFTYEGDFYRTPNEEEVL
jgi:hypothetical protein